MGILWVVLTIITLAAIAVHPPATNPRFPLAALMVAAVSIVKIRFYCNIYIYIYYKIII